MSPQAMPRWRLHTSGAAVNGATSSEPVERHDKYKQHISTKLTCCITFVVALGVLVILLIQVTATLTAVPTWERDARNSMIDLEMENLARLASDKAEFVGEVFGRLEEGILQLQNFAGEILVPDPKTLLVKEYLTAYPGILQENRTWEHSVWWVAASSV